MEWKKEVMRHTAIPRFKRETRSTIGSKQNTPRRLGPLEPQMPLPFIFSVKECLVRALPILGSRDNRLVGCRHDRSGTITYMEQRTYIRVCNHANDCRMKFVD